MRKVLGWIVLAIAAMWLGKKPAPRRRRYPADRPRPVHPGQRAVNRTARTARRYHPMTHPHVTALAERHMTRHRIAAQADARAAAARIAHGSLPAAAAHLAARLREHFDPDMLPVQQVLAVAEEA